ncbi:MAG TPA: exo-alpha-sialidase [Bryobacteraceae bacterium]|nr:exo-alpha-sialidase [Bryobacteraceae bacterium]
MRVTVLLLAAGLVVPAAAQDNQFRWPGGARAAVALTYDDGIDVHLDHAIPDLEAANLRGTFYVPGNSSSLRKRLEEWRGIARRGHELGNHTIFHPCLRYEPGRERTWVQPERQLERYSVGRITGEIAVMNTLLHAVDGLDSRTMAYPCGDETAGGASYVDSIRPLFPAARAYKNAFKGLADPRTLDPHRVPTWALRMNTGAEMIAWVEEAMASGSLAVFTFHGVGGGHDIDVGREDHRRLVAWLAANRSRVWTAPFAKVMEHLLAERRRLTAAHEQETVVYRSGEDGYHTYRIPAAITTRDGTLLAFCEGRKTGREDSGDIDLLVKRSGDGGRTWSRAITVADFGGDTIGNPAPVVDLRNGTVWLLLTSNPGDVPEKDIQAGLTGPTRRVWVTHSNDDGATWAKPREITAAVKRPEWSWYATGPGNGIQLRDGRLMVACDHYFGSTSEQRYSHVIYSDDAGETWKIGGTAGPRCNESTVAERPDGSLVLNMRNDMGRHRRAVSTSVDGGLTWTAPVLDEALIEPVCQGSLLRAGSGKESVLLFANPADTRRRNMTVRLSRDGGATWRVAKVIHPGPAAYSNLVDLRQGWIGLLYERGDEQPYETITLARFRLDSLR